LIAASAALPQSYAIALILAATLGQMTGKSMMFFGGRGVKFLQRGRMKERIDEMGERMRRRNGAIGSMLFMSAAIGLPPFYLVSVASGLVGVAFAQFATIGFLGRFVRFSLVVLFPHLIKALTN
jgi:membrane protein YqaA with SNARE-associated domain